MNSSYNNVKAQQLAGASDTKAEKSSWKDKARKGAIIVGTGGGIGVTVYAAVKGTQMVIEKVRS